MVAIFIAFFVAVLSFNFFVISYQSNGINRLVMYAPLSLFETAIVLYDIDLEEGPYFDKEVLVSNITDYFAFHMPRYTEDYELSYYYYKPSDHSLDMGDHAKAVEVYIDAHIAMNHEYKKTMYYEIWSN